NLRSVGAQALSSPLMDVIGAIAIALLLLVGRDQIKQHIFTAGTFLMFIVAVFKLYDPVRKFAQFYNNFQQALRAPSAIFEFMDVEDDVKDKPDATPFLPSITVSALKTSILPIKRRITGPRQSSRTSIWKSTRARWWRSSVPAAPVSPRWHDCCLAS